MTSFSQFPSSPAEFDALLALARREQSAGRLAEAVAAYRTLLLLRPNVAEVHNSLGNVLKDQGQLDEAAAQYERTVALKPDFFQACNNLGNILKAQGKLDQAVARYEQAIALRPDLAEACYNLGTALKEQGRLDEAAAQYDRALALQPDFAEAHYHAADLKTFRAGDADLAALEALAGDPAALPAEQDVVRSTLRLGKALEDVGDYSRAIRALAQGNALKRREVDYNEAACLGTFRLIADLFDCRVTRIAFQGRATPRRYRSSSSACPVRAARSSSRFWPATLRSTLAEN